MDWVNTQFIYNVTTSILDRGIESMFKIVSTAMSAFSLPITAAAAIYIALVGYSLMTGMISMSARDISSKFAKVIGIILIFQIFANFGDNLFSAVWKIPDDIADYFVKEIAPILNITGPLAILFNMPTGDEITTLDQLSGLYTALVSELGQRVASAHTDPKWSIGTWVVSMAPLVVTIVGISIAKFVSALLFLVSPLVFILSLTMGGFKGNAILSAWFKAIAVSFLTAMFVYIVGTVCMVMTAKYMGALVLADALSGFFDVGGWIGTGDDGFKYTLVQLAPLGILGLFSVVLISQATTVASSLLNAAAITTQQATSFMQIGALQAAK